MARPTIRPHRQDEVRARIQTAQLINRLSDYTSGKIVLEPGQIKAIEILLRKSLPDLTAVQVTGEDGGPVKIDSTLNPTDAYLKLIGKV